MGARRVFKGAMWVLKGTGGFIMGAGDAEVVQKGLCSLATHIIPRHNVHNISHYINVKENLLPLFSSKFPHFILLDLCSV